MVLGMGQGTYDRQQPTALALTRIKAYFSMDSVIDGLTAPRTSELWMMALTLCNQSCGLVMSSRGRQGPGNIHPPYILAGLKKVSLVCLKRYQANAATYFEAWLKRSDGAAAVSEHVS